LDEESLPSGRTPKIRRNRVSRRPAPAVRFDLTAGSSDDESRYDPQKTAAKVEPSDGASEEDSTLLGSVAGQGSPDPITKSKDTYTYLKGENEIDITRNKDSSDDRPTAIDETK